MTYKIFLYAPGGENESGSASADNDENVKDESGQIPESKEPKTVIQKIKEALHDWSNKDEQDQEFDDTRV